MMADRDIEQIADLIERSSLGTAQVKALRESVSVEDADAIVRRVNERSDEGEGRLTWRTW